MGAAPYSPEYPTMAEELAQLQADYDEMASTLRRVLGAAPEEEPRDTLFALEHMVDEIPRRIAQARAEAKREAIKEMSKDAEPMAAELIRLTNVNLELVRQVEEYQRAMDAMVELVGPFTNRVQ